MYLVSIYFSTDRTDLQDNFPSVFRSLNFPWFAARAPDQKNEKNRTKTIAVLTSVVVHLLILWLMLHPAATPPRPKVGSADEITTLLILPGAPNVSGEAATPARKAPQPPTVTSPPPIVTALRRNRPPAPRPPSPASVKPSPAPAQPNPAPTIALDKSLPSTSALATAPAQPITEDDFSSKLAARQRERATAESQERERQQARGTPEQQANERGKQIALGNISSQMRAAGLEKDDAGGLFQLQYVGPHHAEFLFRGWKKEARRNWSQQLQVEQGTESDIRIAVVKKMIEIIRVHTQSDFTWNSPRLGRQINLSARREDSVGLQQFLLREFFPDFDPTAR